MSDNGRMGGGDGFRQLLERCRRGEGEALDLLVRRFREHAMSLATALTPDAATAEDAVQAAFVTVLQHLGQLQEDGAFAGWLRQIVRRECARLTRGERAGALSEVMQAREAGPAEEAERAELRQRVREALAKLPPAQRETAELFYLEEISQAAIGLALEVPEGTVKRRLHDARENLRGRLGIPL